MEIYALSINAVRGSYAVMSCINTGQAITIGDEWALTTMLYSTDTV